MVSDMRAAPKEERELVLECIMRADIAVMKNDGVTIRLTPSGICDLSQLGKVSRAKKHAQVAPLLLALLMELAALVT
jgi:hypothetical protein